MVKENYENLSVFCVQEIGLGMAEVRLEAGVKVDTVQRAVYQAILACVCGVTQSLRQFLLGLSLFGFSSRGTLFELCPVHRSLLALLFVLTFFSRVVTSSNIPSSFQERSRLISSMIYYETVAQALATRRWLPLASRSA